MFEKSVWQIPLSSQAEHLLCTIISKIPWNVNFLLTSEHIYGIILGKGGDIMRTVATNAIDPASTTSASFGFIPNPGKGGKTTNAEIYESILRNSVDKNEDLW